MKNKKNLETADFIVSQAQLSLDLKMVSFDVQGTIAHVLMLNKQKAINDKNASIILKALKEIGQEIKNNKFVIDPNKGAQLSLEAKIIEKVGEIGYSVHTGRSRNDQVMVTEMLYLKQEIIEVIKIIVPTLETLYNLAKNNIKTADSVIIFNFRVCFIILSYPVQ